MSALPCFNIWTMDARGVELRHKQNFAQIHLICHLPSAIIERDQGDSGAAKACGTSPDTQEISGAFGSARKDTITAWAQGDQGETICPMPGTLMMVALDNFTAAAFAPASDVNVSKVPEMSSVGMALSTGWCMASGAAGNFQTSRQSSLKYAQPPTPSSCIDAG